MVRCMEVSQEKGYVWIGTRSGIGRFDGYEQRRYLRGNVTHILEDERTYHLGHHRKGVFRYNEKEDKFTLVRDKDNNPVIASSLCLWRTEKSWGKRQSIQIQCQMKSHIINLFQYVEAERQVSYFQSLPVGFPALSWPPTDGQKLCLLISLRATPRPVPFNSEQIISLLIDKKGNVWVAHYNQGVSCYDRNGKQLQTLSYTKLCPSKTNVVLSLEEHNGQISDGYRRRRNPYYYSIRRPARSRH